ncbi:MAG: hypothetical protein ABIH89_06760 [Elusimicrobiota bacterium]
MLLCICSESSSAFGRWFAGTYGGLVIPDEQGSRVRFGRGVEFGRNMSGEMDAGIFILTSAVREKILSSNVKDADSFILFSVNYSFLEPVEGIYIGGKLGIVDRRLWNMPLADGQTTGASALGYGMEAGYEYMVSRNVSVSGGISYLHAGEAESTVSGSSTVYIITYEAISYVNIFARLRVYL